MKGGITVKETMAVVVIEPKKPARKEIIENSLEAMQKVVGGYIEVIPAEWMVGGNLLLNRNLLLVLNEEGKLEGLEPNFPTKDGWDYIFGTVFVCKKQEDEMVGLSDEEVNLVIGLVHRKEERDG